MPDLWRQIGRDDVFMTLPVDVECEVTIIENGLIKEHLPVGD